MQNMTNVFFRKLSYVLIFFVFFLLKTEQDRTIGNSLKPCITLLLYFVFANGHMQKSYSKFSGKGFTGRTCSLLHHLQVAVD